MDAISATEKVIPISEAEESICFRFCVSLVTGIGKLENDRAFPEW
jgi:hypothetical protein